MIRFNRKSILAALVCIVFLAAAACQSKKETGAVVGGAAGAGLGAILGGEEHRVEGAIIGGLLGGAVGYFAGTKLTENDQKNVYDTLESTPAGETRNWTSSNGSTYYVTPSETWTENGKTYRKLNVRVVKPNGEETTEERTAYKEGDKWQVVGSDTGVPG